MKILFFIMPFLSLNLLAADIVVEEISAQSMLSEAQQIYNNIIKAKSGDDIEKFDALTSALTFVDKEQAELMRRAELAMHEKGVFAGWFLVANLSDAIGDEIVALMPLINFEKVVIEKSLSSLQLLFNDLGTSIKALKADEGIGELQLQTDLFEQWYYYVYNFLTWHKNATDRIFYNEKHSELHEMKAQLLEIIESKEERFREERAKNLLERAQLEYDAFRESNNIATQLKHAPEGLGFMSNAKENFANALETLKGIFEGPYEPWMCEYFERYNDITRFGVEIDHAYEKITKTNNEVNSDEKRGTKRPGNLKDRSHRKEKKMRTENQ